MSSGFWIYTSPSVSREGTGEGVHMIDLYSDTKTKPTVGMRGAIANAEVGDSQKDEDPTVLLLQEMVADLVGKEAALFLPSGTMCNQIALKTHTNHGETVIADRLSHTLISEAGAAGLISGVLFHTLDGDRGRYTPEQVEAAIQPGSRYASPTTLLWAEQTNVYGGGSIWPLKQLQDVAEVARAVGLATHLDGARLLNATVATGVPASDYAAGFDSVWICLTKGLGCPIGAVLAGNADFIDQARYYQHKLGGAMRQAGIVAAAGIYALENHVERLAEDHANARLLAAGLKEIDGIGLLTDPPDTNMVFFEVDETGMSTAEFLAAIQNQGVVMCAIAPGQIRAVAHLDITSADIESALDAVQSVLATA
jgi:threonine aldolase